jgi:hypothetical protein
MVTQTNEYTVSYIDDKIVLEGPHEAIHTEALKILRRFAYSLRPYKIESDSDDRVVLGLAR